MTEEFKPFRCVECGAMVELKAEPGRTSEYRDGITLPIPDDFAIPTCTNCGERYFDVERGAALEILQSKLLKNNSDLK